MPAASSRAPTPGRPLRRDAQRNRERVLAAARETFAERGLEATLDDVAARAGVGVATVYRRYANKSALLDEVFEDRIDELSRLAEDSLAGPDAWQGLVGFLERVTELFAADRALTDLVVGSEGGQQRIARARTRLQAPVAALVEHARDEGRLRPDFEQGDIAMIHAMLAGVIDLTHDVDADRWRRYLVLILDGLATERSAPTPLPTGSSAERRQ